MSDDDVIQMPVRNKQQDSPELFLVPPPYEKCSHFGATFEVDVNGGKCICRECGGEVSPYFVLEQLMKKESLWNRSRELYKDEMARLAKRSKTKCQHCGNLTKISHR